MRRDIDAACASPHVIARGKKELILTRGEKYVDRVWAPSQSGRGYNHAVVEDVSRRDVFRDTTSKRFGREEHVVYW